MRWRSRNGHRTVLLGAVAALALCAAPAPALARVRALTGRFEQVGSGIDGLATSGSYALITRGLDEIGGPSYTARDDTTGAQWRIPSEQGCSLLGMGAPWALFTCHNAPALSLYDLPTRTVVRFRCAVCQTVDPTSVAAIGSHWLWVYQSVPCSGSHDCNPPPESVFVRVPEGTASSFAPSGELAANLDSPGLRERVCWTDTPVIGPLTSSSALFGNALIWPGPLSVQPGPVTGASPYSNEIALLLEGCAGHPAISLFASGAHSGTTQLVASRQAVVWWTGGRQVVGIAIRSFMRFTLALPAVPRDSPPPPGGLGTAVWRGPSIRLTSSHLYYLDADHRLWAARLALPTEHVALVGRRSRSHRIQSNVSRPGSVSLHVR